MRHAARLGEPRLYAAQTQAHTQTHRRLATQYLRPLSDGGGNKMTERETAEVYLLSRKTSFPVRILNKKVELQFFFQIDRFEFESLIAHL